MKSRMIILYALLGFTLYVGLGFWHAESIAQSLSSGSTPACAQLYRSLPGASPMFMYVLEPWLNPKPELTLLYNQYYFMCVPQSGFPLPAPNFKLNGS